jgi:hypothetical protein
MFWLSLVWVKKFADSRVSTQSLSNKVRPVNEEFHNVVSKTIGGFKGIPLYFLKYPTILGHLHVYVSIYLYVYMYNSTFCSIFAQFSPKQQKNQPFDLFPNIVGLWIRFFYDVEVGIPKFQILPPPLSKTFMSIEWNELGEIGT